MRCALLVRLYLLVSPELRQCLIQPVHPQLRRRGVAEVRALQAMAVVSMELPQGDVSSTWTPPECPPGSSPHSLAAVHTDTHFRKAVTHSSNHIQQLAGQLCMHRTCVQAMLRHVTSRLWG